MGYPYTYPFYYEGQPDTAARKRRMAACLTPFYKAPIPDSVITVKDRAHIAWTYGNLVFSTVELSVTDGIKAGDTPSSQVVFQTQVTDGIKAGDTPGTQVVFQTSVTDGIKAGDTPTPQVIFQTLVTDGIKAGDAPTAQTVVQIVVTDGVTVGDLALTLGRLLTLKVLTSQHKHLKIRTAQHGTVKTRTSQHRIIKPFTTGG